MFGALKKMVSGATSKLNGNKDALEAICAAAALIAIADGEIEESEISTAINAVAATPAVAGAFSASEVEAVAGRMFERAKTMVGRLGLYKEIEQIAKNAETAEIVLLTAIEAASADGEIEPKEKPVILKIAKSLGLDASRYMDV